jgi:predicted oxidoreductase
VAYKAWGNTLNPADEVRIGEEITRQATAYGVEPWVVVLAWLLLLPSGVAPILGSTQPARITAALKALTLPYTREDFYRLLEARKGHRVP